MIQNDSCAPEADTGTKLLAGALRFGSKRDVATMLQMSVRSVDNYVARGCPCIALSKRRLRFDLAEVREWFKQQYGQQRRGKAA
jgi:predicted DNA-binding transcriptional regulator AlpA